MAKASNSGAKSASQWYIILYNEASFLGWFWILYIILRQLWVTGGDYTTVFEVVWPWLKIIQSAALLEVVHAATGLVRAPFMTTAMQVASRLFLVWCINYLFPAIHTHGSFTTMTIAWCIAECIRYSYYAFNLVSTVPKAISWARYTFFFVLYPAGVGSELVMIYQALPYAQQWSSVYYYMVIAVALTYIPGFPILFSHMLVQRKKYFRGEAKAVKKQ
ncbi:tyrosine phosphatase-like protein [Spinellus fusiger]|nr:tyrosine phosphatase-like protein [Spinellus fusiger]